MLLFVLIVLGCLGVLYMLFKGIGPKGFAECVGAVLVLTLAQHLFHF